MTIITADWLIANAEEEPLRSHGIRILDAEIMEVGKIQDLKAKYPDDDLIVSILVAKSRRCSG